MRLVCLAFQRLCPCLFRAFILSSAQAHATAPLPIPGLPDHMATRRRYGVAGAAVLVRIDAAMAVVGSGVPMGVGGSVAVGRHRHIDIWVGAFVDGGGGELVDGVLDVLLRV